MFCIEIIEYVNISIVLINFTDQIGLLSFSRIFETCFIFSNFLSDRLDKQIIA